MTQFEPAFESIKKANPDGFAFCINWQKQFESLLETAKVLLAGGMCWRKRPIASGGLRSATA